MVREKVAYRRSRKPTGPVRFNSASSCASRSGPGWSSSNANQEPPPWRIDLCRTATTCANSRGVSGTDCWALLSPRTVSLGLTIPCSAAAPPSLKAATTTLPVLQVVSHLWRAQHIQCGAVRRPGWLVAYSKRIPRSEPALSSSRKWASSRCEFSMSLPSSCLSLARISRAAMST